MNTKTLQILTLASGLLLLNACGGGSKSTTPDANTSVPNTNTTQPDVNTTVPDTNTTQPDVNTTVPVVTSITHNGTTYGFVTSPHTKRVWLDRNLGAARVCESFDDVACYGDYYQWGRNADGHEDSASDMYRVTSLQIKPGHRDFIIGVGDWISRRVDDNGVARIKNWSSVDGSSICPVGFRVPTVQEIKKDTLDATTKVTNSATAFENFLKLPSAGYRKNSNGDFQNLGNNNGLSGGIWAVSPVNRSFSPSIYFTKDDAGKFDDYRATGHSIRCIKH